MKTASHPVKKLAIILLCALSGAIILMILGSYIGYRTYWAKDPVVVADTSYLSYFHESYEECRAAFYTCVESLEGDFDSIETGKITIPSRIDEDLTIDWCYIPAQHSKDKLLIINSGVHGIEGYTGSAIQQMFMDQILRNQIPDDMGVLLLHGLNPYGFKYHRRVTEHNVDLNRNCITADQNFNIANHGYAALKDLLMPQKPVNLNSIYNQFFYLKAILKILKESMPVLRQAALQGQHDFENGIYYGGKEYEPQLQLLRPLLSETINDYHVVLNLDLHTGYGERGILHLFIDKPEDEAVFYGIETIFKDVAIDWGSSDDFYTINGEYTVWANSLVPDAFCIPMMFEFGTMNSQKTLGALKSIQYIILENEGAHYGYKNKKHEVKTKALFDEVYYPSSSAWRSKVISDTYEMMNFMIENYEAFDYEIDP